MIILFTENFFRFWIIAAENKLWWKRAINLICMSTTLYHSMIWVNWFRGRIFMGRKGIKVSKVEIVIWNWWIKISKELRQCFSTSVSQTILKDISRKFRIKNWFYVADAEEGREALSWDFKGLSINDVM